MIDSNFLNYSCLEPLNVSRETFPELEQFRQTIIEKNKVINLISKDSVNASKERHIIDSAQIIDLIDLNGSVCTDIGSGSGLPGIVLAIIMKHKKSDMKFKVLVFSRTSPEDHSPTLSFMGGGKAREGAIAEWGAERPTRKSQ